MKPRFCFVVVAGLVSLGSLAQAQPLRVMSLDQCADQYVLSLVPDADLALSPRSDDDDSWAQDQAKAHRRLRPTFEAGMGFRPDVVVRYWGGDPRLLAAFERRGAKILTIQDATDMQAVRENITRVSLGLDQGERGQALIARMDRQLSEAAGAGQGRTILYTTPGGYTGAKGTLMDAILTSAGFRNAAKGQGFVPMGIEALVFSPPALVVRGFYQMWRSNWRASGRHPVVDQLTKDRVVTEIKASTLSCPAWFAAEASLDLARAAR